MTQLHCTSVGIGEHSQVFSTWLKEILKVVTVTEKRGFGSKIAGRSPG